MLAEAPLSAYYLDILGTGRVTIADAMGLSVSYTHLDVYKRQNLH